MPRPILYMMLGFPGAGKTTTAEIIAQLTGAIHLSSDQFRLHMIKKPQKTPAEHEAVYGALDYMTEQLLSHGVSTIYDANLNHYQYRQEKYRICQQTDAQPVLIWINVSPELASKRATELGQHDKTRRPWGNLSREVFDKIIREFEPPHKNEPAIEIDGEQVTPRCIRQVLQSIKSPS